MCPQFPGSWGKGVVGLIAGMLRPGQGDVEKEAADLRGGLHQGGERGLCLLGYLGLPAALSEVRR